MHRGYIKVWRKIQESFIWEDSEILKIFIYLIMSANYQETEFLFNGKKEILKRGDLMCGRHKLSAELGISENKIYRVLAILEKEQLIEQRKTNLFTIVSILNYNQYQSNEQLNEQPVDNQQTTSRQPVDTSKELRRTKKKVEEVSDLAFISNLKTKYTWIDLDTELTKMDAWILTNPHRKKTRKFVVNWLNRIEKPMTITPKPKIVQPKIPEYKTDPKQQEEVSRLIHETAQRIGGGIYK